MFDRPSGRIHLKLNNRPRFAGHFSHRSGERLTMPAIEKIRHEGILDDHGIAILSPPDLRGFREIPRRPLRAEKLGQTLGDAAGDRINRCDRVGRFRDVARRSGQTRHGGPFRERPQRDYGAAEPMQHNRRIRSFRRQVENPTAKHQAHRDARFDRVETGDPSSASDAASVDQTTSGLVFTRRASRSVDAESAVESHTLPVDPFLDRPA